MPFVLFQCVTIALERLHFTFESLDLCPLRLDDLEGLVQVGVRTRTVDTNAERDGEEGVGSFEIKDHDVVRVSATSRLRIPLAYFSQTAISCVFSKTSNDSIISRGSDVIGSCCMRYARFERTFAPCVLQCTSTSARIR